MNRIISEEMAGRLLLAALLLLALFHLAVMLHVVPSNIVWAGHATGSDMVVMEGVALVVTLFFALITAVRRGYVGRGNFRVAAKVGMWVMSVFFVLNTVGNLASDAAFENLVFAPLTAFLAALSFRLAVAE